MTPEERLIDRLGMQNDTALQYFPVGSRARADYLGIRAEAIRVTNSPSGRILAAVPLAAASFPMLTIEAPLVGATAAARQAPLVLDAAEGVATGGLRSSAVVSSARAEQFLVKQGFSPTRAAEFVGSFDGPITARLVRPGEDFLRYTDVGDSTGSFLGKTRFSTPSDAVSGLYLGPYGNGATLVQPVTSTGRSIVLEGAVRNGGAGINQTVIYNRSAFEFGLGVPY